MKRIEIDLDRREVIVTDDAGQHRHPFASDEGFAAVSDAWLQCGWDAKHVYGFSWMGRPIIQLPDDLVRIQEVVWAVQPDVIVETGVAHGGSLIFYASLCKAIGRGRVVGIDIEIRPANRAAIEAHPLFSFISLIEGSSVAPEIVSRVASEIRPNDRVLVLLDSNHTKAHVLAELDAYASLVSPGSYIVAMDGIMAQVVGAPRTTPDWSWNHPRAAVHEWLSRHPEFVLEEPEWPFNEGLARRRVTYWPDAFLKRR
jgi:cephalosporin hydroxylase